MYVSLSPFDEITVHVFRIDLFIVEKSEDVQRIPLRSRSTLPLIREMFPLAPTLADSLEIPLWKLLVAVSSYRAVVWSGSCARPRSVTVGGRLELSCN